MHSLFPDPPLLPEGFSYYPDFLSEDEEIRLLGAVASVELHALVFQGFTAKRKVKSFGYDYNFERRLISKGEVIPDNFSFLIDKVAALTGIDADAFAEMLVTEYPAGAVINWHRDAPPFDVIVGISLLSDCKFRFRPYDKSKQDRASILSVPVARRSLYILDGEARTDWEHSTAPVKDQRYSLTLRTLRK